MTPTETKLRDALNLMTYLADLYVPKILKREGNTESWVIEHQAHQEIFDVAREALATTAEGNAPDGAVAYALQKVADTLEIYAESYQQMARQNKADPRVNMTTVEVDIRRNMKGFVLEMLAEQRTAIAAAQPDCTQERTVHAGEMVDLPSAWLVTHPDGTSCSTSEKHAKSYAEISNGELEPLFKKAALAQRKPAGSIDAITEWAETVKPKISQWCEGYNAARTWVKAQLDAHSGKVGQPVYQIANDSIPSGWSDVPRGAYDAWNTTMFRKKRILFTTPQPAAQVVEGGLKADDVQWITNDNAELGVKIGNQFFFLYKGYSLVYESGMHDNDTPMMWRPVFKREFGECAHPINHKDYSKIGTVSLGDSEEWKPIIAILKGDAQ